MILSASRRTDIPCWYSEWFMNRIRDGYALTRNPMNHRQISRILLSTDIVDCIVFWTKDARNIMGNLEELDRRGYHYYFQFTLTPYDQTLEKNLRPKTEIEDTFIELSKRIGKTRVVWRYDPIIRNETHDMEYHKKQFRRMCDKLSEYTDTVMVSFVDMYKKLHTPLVQPFTQEEVKELSVFIDNTSREYGLNAVACCEELLIYGMEKTACIDQKRIEKIIGSPLGVKGDKNQREGCCCCESVDIGIYNTCTNGCVYCYANQSLTSANTRFHAHNPKEGLLFGQVLEGERITERKVRSNKQNQMKLFE